MDALTTANKTLFLSYSRVQTEWCDNLDTAIDQETNYQRWRDNKIPEGAHWWDNICRNIEGCFAFVAILSEDYLQSIYCMGELEYALKLNKPIIALMLQDVPYPPGLDQRHIQFALVNGLPMPQVINKVLTATNHILQEYMVGKFSKDISSRPRLRPPVPGQPPEPPMPYRITKVIPFILIIVLILVLIVTQLERQNERPNPTSSVLVENATDEIVQTTEPIATPTTSPTNTPTVTAMEISFSRQTSNDGWLPHIIETEFSGVTMVLVPTGCVIIGSNSGSDDEQPLKDICFDEPFWIDKYEVTNALFGSTGCTRWSSASNQPRNCVSWFDANSHCQMRSARLPTEVEWEYAAKGPDNLVYPWGNMYDPALVIGDDDPEYGDVSPAPVGSRPGGASWVGAMDMSGNLWEWTSSAYYQYPYEGTDGRENHEDITTPRVFRGGGFTYPAYDLRTTHRIANTPESPDFALGFRCVRQF